MITHSKMSSLYVMAFGLFFLIFTCATAAPAKAVPLKKSFGLSSDQRAQLIKIKREHKKNLKAAIKEQKRLQKQLADKLSAKTSDSQLRGLQERVTANRTRIEKLKFERVLKVRNVLNAKQRARFDDIYRKKMQGKLKIKSAKKKSA